VDVLNNLRLIVKTESRTTLHWAAGRHFHGQREANHNRLNAISASVSMTQKKARCTRVDAASQSNHASQLSGKGLR